MPKLRKRTSRYDQLQTLLYGQIRVQGVKPETLIGCCRRRRRTGCRTSAA